MDRKLLVMILLWLVTTVCFAQTSNSSKFAGQWVNLQYEYFKDKPGYSNILYKISPWFLNVDASGKCTVTLIFEQQAKLGYPINKKSRNGIIEYHYKKGIDTWLFSVEGNDSLLVYSNGNTPGAGIIFKKYFSMSAGR